MESPAPTARYSFEDAKPQGDIRVVDGKHGKTLEFGGDDAFVCKGAGIFGRTTPFSFSLWLKPGEPKPRQVIFHRSRAAEDSAFRGYALVLDDGRPVFSLVHFWPGNALRVQTADTIPANDWTHLTITYDGGSKAGGVHVYINGVAAKVDTIRDKLSRDIVHRAEWGDYDSGSVELALGARFRDAGFKGGSIADFRVFDRELSAAEVPLIGDFKIEQGDDNLFSHFLCRHDEAYQTTLKELQKLRTQENELVGQVRQIMVMSEMPERRPAYVLKRGVYTQKGEEVQPDTPCSILPFPKELPRNRLGFARWLIDERNPLTARVAVNRFWAMFFGRGLVATPEDFGVRGQAPTHPELLDWLARHFMDSGWDVKAVCRTIVLSSTYRQSSIPSDRDLYNNDPDNRLLARGPRHRLSAEQIRDNALSVSGLLVQRLGGPSVMPYQPSGLWEEAGTGKSYHPSHGEGLYRRSLYTFWRRISPPPSMTTFDAANREYCTARRERTSTPLQALVLLNDPQFVEAARVLAERLIHEHGDSTDARLDHAFRLLTSRAPSDREMSVLRAAYQEQREHFDKAPDDATALLSVGESRRDEKLNAADHAATTVVVKILLNFDESVTKR